MYICVCITSKKCGPEVKKCAKLLIIKNTDKSSYRGRYTL